MHLDIRRKALIFIGAAGLATSLLLGALLLWWLGMAEELLERHAAGLGAAVTAEAEHFTQEETQKRLEATLLLKAQHLDSLLEEMEGDVLVLSRQMSRLMQEGGVTDRRIHDPRLETVTSGQLYFLAGANGGEPSPLARRAAAIEDTMRHLAQSYEVYPLLIYVGSKEGWSLRMDFLAGERDMVTPPPVALTPVYDVRDRNWYKVGQAAFDTGYPAYTPIYMAPGGVPLMACVMAYEDETGLAGVVGLGVPPEAIYGKFYQEVAEEGKISFVLNKDGQMVFSSAQEGSMGNVSPEADQRQSANKSLAEVAAAMTRGERGSRLLEVDGREYCLVYAPVGELGWSMGELEDMGEVQAPARAIGAQVAEEMDAVQAAVRPLFPRMRFLLLVSFGLLLLMLFWVSWRWARDFSRPIQQLALGAGRVAEGHFGERLELHTGDEVEQLAESFNDMTAALQSHMAELAAVSSEKAKVAAGLEIATRIQRGLLPRDFPSGGNFALYAAMEPAKEVGGDFYDFYFLDENHLVVTMADVSGKGIPAALFMVVSRTLLKNSLLVTGDLAVAFRDTNERLVEGNEEDLFVTVFAGVLDISTGEFVYANAGHCPPLIKGADGIRTLPKFKSPMLGIQSGLNFPVAGTQLAPGELLLLYTDGVTEAMDGDRKLFGNDRLEKVMAAATRDVSPRALVQALQEAIREYVGEAEQSDDITILAVSWAGEILSAEA